MATKFAFDMKSAAEAAGVSIPTMRELAQRPDFPAFRAGRRWVIPCDLFKAWLEKQAKAQRVFGDCKEDA